MIILDEVSANVNWSSTGTFNGILLDGDTSTADRITFSADAPSSVGRVIYINGGIILGTSASEHSSDQEAPRSRLHSRLWALASWPARSNCTGEAGLCPTLPYNRTQSK